MLYLVGNGFICVHVGNPSAQEKPTPAVSHWQSLLHYVVSTMHVNNATMRIEPATLVVRYVYRYV